MKIVFAAHRIARIGGMERAASEVSDYLADRHRAAVVTTLSDLSPEKVENCIIKMPRLPALLRSYWFRVRARSEIRRLEPATSLSVGAAVWPVDVMVVQFCHAAFWKLPAHVRPSSLYQKAAAMAFLREERAAVRSKRLKGMIAVSKGVAEEMVRCHGYPAQRIKVVPNGVDIDVFRPVSSEQKSELRRRYGLEEQDLVAIFVGGDWSRKGLGFAIDAMQGLPSARLLIVGGGGRERPDFERKVAECGLQQRVTFCGRSDKPWELYQMADVCVQPTYYEAFSLVSLEAAASGLPLLMPDVNGAADLVKHGHNGFICERDSGSIRSMLEHFLNDRARLQSMSHAAREVSLDYDWHKIGARFEKALLELLEEDKAAQERERTP